MMRLPRLAAVLVFAATWGGCVRPVPTDEGPCPCSAGFVCNAATNRCVRSAGNGAPDADEGSRPDAAMDATLDVGEDGALDAGEDGAMNAGPDVAMDAGHDAAPDAAMDAGLDATTDTGPDAALDAARDASPDSGADGGLTRPILSRVIPNDAPVGMADSLLELVSDAANFAPNSGVMADGTVLAMMGRSPRLVWTTLPASMMTSPRTIQLTVVTSGFAPSQPVPFTVRTYPNGSIRITSLSSITGAGLYPTRFSVTLNGNGYSPTMLRRDLPTYFVGPYQGAGVPSGNWDTSLNIEIRDPATRFMSTAGSLPIVVRNSNGEWSNTVNVGILLPFGNPAPAISSITPSPLGVGTGDIDVSVRTYAFGLATSTATLTASIGALSVMRANPCYFDLPVTTCIIRLPSTMLQAPGMITFTLSNPAPGGGQDSSTLTVIPGNPYPQLLSISPGTFQRDGPGGTVTLNGSGFNTSSTVTETNTATSLAVTSVSSTRLTATVPASLVRSPATSLGFRVSNPAPAGGTTQTLRAMVN